MEWFKAFVFGVTVAAPMGPIAVLLIRAGLNQPTSVVLWSACEVALADLTYAIAALVAGSTVTTLLQDHRVVFEAASALLLCALGFWLARVAWVQHSTAPGGQIRKRMARGQFYLLTLANPLTILLFIGFSGQMSAHTAGSLLGNALALFVGSLAVQLGYVAFGAALQRWLVNDRAIRAFNAASGLGIAAFGLYGLAAVMRAA
jgi:threonine/homoserine/homoserine lactone efflux protein